MPWDENARQRIGNEDASGTLVFLGGTIIEKGVIVKLGTRAIVENGKIVGWKPDDQ